MQLVLVLGDLCIPNRCYKLPDEFKKLLVPGKIKHILCTGNVCSKSMDQYLRNLIGGGGGVHIVRGDMDDNKSYPEMKKVTIGGFDIGLCHGHQVVPTGHWESLSNLQRMMNVDILVTGCTHKSEVAHTADKKYLVNPGSATGASTFSGEATRPSFILMAIKKSSVVTYVYQLLPDRDEDTGERQLDVKKSEFNKPTA